MKFADYLDKKGNIPYLYNVYTENGNRPLKRSEYNKYRDYDLAVFDEYDYDEEGNNCGISWGVVVKPQ